MGTFRSVAVIAALMTMGSAAAANSEDGVATASVMATRAGRPPVTVFGRAGSFGTAIGSAVAGWGFLPGQSAYFAAVDSLGRVFIADEPQTDNQADPTATTMAISVFDPSAARFTNLVVPTSTGAQSATAANGVGGADVGDIHVIGGERLAVLSSAPYNGWNAVQLGVYPTYATVGLRTSSLASSFTGAQLRAASTAGAGVCNRALPTSFGPVADCGGLAEFAVLPKSGFLAVSRFWDNGVVILDPTGRIVAALDYPAGIDAHAREVDADPTSKAGDERFLVIFDTFGTPQPPFVAQEFRWTGKVIEPVTVPFTTGGTSHGVAMGTETAVYDHDGNLWIAEARSRTLDGGRLVRYSRSSGLTKLRSACAAIPGDVAKGWGTACAPDLTTDVTTGHALVRSLTDDAARHRVVAVTMDGTVATAAGTGGRVVLRLPLDALVDRTRFWIGPRKGATDPTRSWLWVPIQQTRTSACAGCAPAVLDQWLVRIDLLSL